MNTVLIFIPQHSDPCATADTDNASYSVKRQEIAPVKGTVQEVTVL